MQAAKLLFLIALITPACKRGVNAAGPAAKPTAQLTDSGCNKDAEGRDPKMAVDPAQPIQHVGGAVYFNVCAATANAGKGFGDAWDCGNAKCASPDSTFSRYCVIDGSGGTPAKAADAAAAGC